MVNTTDGARWSGVSRLVGLYVLVVVATIAALAVLTETKPSLATDDAWVHVVIVAVFAVLMPIRLRGAKRGNAHAQRVVGLVAAVLLVVNVVEALIPGFFPMWLRVEMVGIAALMAGIVVLSVRARR